MDPHVHITQTNIRIDLNDVYFMFETKHLPCYCLPLLCLETAKKCTALSENLLSFVTGRFTVAHLHTTSGAIQAKGLVTVDNERDVEPPL